MKWDVVLKVDENKITDSNKNPNTTRKSLMLGSFYFILLVIPVNWTSDFSVSRWYLRLNNTYHTLHVRKWLISLRKYVLTLITNEIPNIKLNYVVLWSQHLTAIIVWLCDPPPNTVHSCYEIWITSLCYQVCYDIRHGGGRIMLFCFSTY